MSVYPKQYLNLFSHFCTVKPMSRVTDGQTDRQTPRTSVRIDCIHLMHSMQPNKIWQIKYFSCCICYPDIVLMQEVVSFTGDIAVVTLTSSSKTVRWHIMYVRQLSSCCVKLRSSSVRTYGRPMAPILILLIIIYGRDAESCVSDTNSRRGRPSCLLLG